MEHVSCRMNRNILTLRILDLAVPEKDLRRGPDAGLRILFSCISLATMKPVF